MVYEKHNTCQILKDNIYILLNELKKKITITFNLGVLFLFSRRVGFHFQWLLIDDIARKRTGAHFAICTFRFEATRVVHTQRELFLLSIQLSEEK